VDGSCCAASTSRAVTLEIWPDDIFLVSFPKSGNTWTRFLIANLVHPEEKVGFENIHRLVPDPFATAKKDFDQMSRRALSRVTNVFEAAAIRT